MERIFKDTLPINCMNIFFFMYVMNAIWLKTHVLSLKEPFISEKYKISRLENIVL